ncbi:MAG: NIPSNAP family protein [Alphaproteobacteria bacterium]|nr:NIPSNAP family protein [Alphaproteobacteria bacterium]TAD91887.1 MAG: NIPSNAP family protein [Alphaproteobacteria bacterium]
MIIEERDYRVKVGKLPEFVRLHGTKGLPVQIPVLGNLIGHFTTDIGGLSRIVHLWGYDSYAERERRRAELAALPEWQAYLDEALPLLEEMTSRILLPTSFSPIR